LSFIQSLPPPDTNSEFILLNDNRRWLCATINNNEREAAMRQFMMTVMALASFAAFAGKAQAYIDYPWCLMGDTRGYECVFSTREQCMQDGRNRGFGSQCIQNPYYKPGAPTVSGEKRTVSKSTRPSQAGSTAHQRGCIPTTVYVGGSVSTCHSGTLKEGGPEFGQVYCPGAWRAECR
jgi:hypothetical protein